jgi:hypothetical protein
MKKWLKKLLGIDVLEASIEANRKSLWDINRREVEDRESIDALEEDVQRLIGGSAQFVAEHVKLTERVKALENGDFVAQHVTRFDSNEVYFVVLPETTPHTTVDAVRKTLESRGVIAIVVASDSVNVVRVGT